MFVVPNGCDLSYTSPFYDPTKVPEISSVQLDEVMHVDEGTPAEFAAALGVAPDAPDPHYGATKGSYAVRLLSPQQAAAFKSVVHRLEAKLRSSAALARYGGRPSVRASKLKALRVGGGGAAAAQVPAMMVVDLAVFGPPSRLFGTQLRVWCSVDAATGLRVDRCVLVGRFTGDEVLLKTNDPAYVPDMRLYYGRDDDYATPLIR